MIITVITKYDGGSADIFVGAIACRLSEISEQKRFDLRREFDCDGAGETPEDDDDASNLFFRELEVGVLGDTPLTLMNADGENAG